jgi:hypothetical protein
MTADPATPLCPQVYRKASDQTVLCTISFAFCLDDGSVPAGGSAEQITGSPAVTDATGDLTIDSIVISSTVLRVNGELVPSGQAIQFTVAGGTDDTAYKIIAKVTTDASKINLPAWCTLQVHDD